jgi:hypothetical protein
MTIREQLQMEILEIANELGHYSPRTYAQSLAVGFLEGKNQLRRYQIKHYVWYEITYKGAVRLKSGDLLDVNS